ncbi:MAG TPA: N-acetyltransferase [Candidatus Agrococcus pullicola]|uniref:N-acetyltransferase n=1 Tax=Candidatus Agrococcus pullicola TaxID=2838429 RepID=A0A9D2C987_9MICO|nr:N-acetyltransferase [Candidatus Agrococcus pullicola]
MSENIEVQHAPGLQRFEITVDGKLAGTASYIDDEANVRSFTSTHVSDEYGGRGLGSKLVDYALQSTVEDGLRIQAICSFVVKKVEDERWHPHTV